MKKVSLKMFKDITDFLRVYEITNDQLIAYQGKVRAKIRNEKLDCVERSDLARHAAEVRWSGWLGVRNGTGQVGKLKKEWREILNKPANGAAVVDGGAR